MSLNDNIAKARAAEQKLLNKVNQEQNWVAQHPGWVSAIGLVLFVALIVAVVKGCH